MLAKEIAPKFDRVSLGSNEKHRSGQVLRNRHAKPMLTAMAARHRRHELHVMDGEGAERCFKFVGSSWRVAVQLPLRDRAG